MELVTDSDYYSPSIDDKGNYIDKIPSFNNIKNGLRCPCGTRKDKTYDCSGYFTTHIKTKTHQKWIEELNTNKSNYFTENIKLRETISNQKIIIAKLEKDVNTKILTIDFLTQQIANSITKCDTVSNLLEFD